MFLSILMQNIINGQSFVSGFVANFRFYNIGALALIFYWFIKYKISVRHLIRGLIMAGWINLLVIVLMYVTEYSFINESELTGIVVVTHAGIMKKSLIDLVAIIYLTYFFNRNKYKYLILAILFFSIHHIYELQRFALLTQIFLFYIAFRKIYNFKAKLKFFVPALLAIFLINFFLFDSEAGKNTLDRYNASFMVLSENTEIKDSSTQARILQVGVALEFFKNSPFFGNGIFRSSEKGNIFGDEYFHLSDIGIFGLLYVFGILGLLILFFQYKFLYQSMVYINLNIWSGIGVLSLLYLLINSLLSAKSILSFSFFLFCVLLIEFSKLERKNKFL